MSCTDEKVELVLSYITNEGVEYFANLLHGRYSKYKNGEFFIITGDVSHKELLEIITEYNKYLLPNTKFHMIINPQVPFTTLRLTATREK